MTFKPVVTPKGRRPKDCTLSASQFPKPLTKFWESSYPEGQQSKVFIASFAKNAGETKEPIVSLKKVFFLLIQ
jgi:hypothetical protein